MNEGLRKAIGWTSLLMGLLVYCLLAIVLMGQVMHWPVLVQMLGYLLLGIAWIVPAFWLLRWTYTGRWRR